MKKPLLTTLTLGLVMLFQSVNANASEITIDKYVLNVDNQQKVTDIYVYKDAKNKNLEKYYKINNVKYNEDKKVKEYLNHKTLETAVNNDKMVHTYQYQNNKLINYYKYESNRTFSISHLLNKQYIQYNYIVNNNKLYKIEQYYHNSKALYRLYQNYSNQKFVKDHIGNYYRLYELNKNNTLKYRNDYYSNRNKKMYTTFYSNTTFKNMATKRKYRYYFNTAQHLTRQRLFYNNSTQFKSNTTFYGSTSYAKRATRRKTVHKVTNRGIITSQVMYANNSKTVIRRYYYKKNTKLYKNHQKRLTKINYYAINRGKHIKTGYKLYKNGHRTGYYVNLKNIPYYNQMREGYPSGCEFFSLRMALGYKGKHVSSAKLYKQMKKSMNRPKYNKKKHRWTWANPDKKFLGNPRGVMTNKANWGINPKGLLPLGLKYQKGIKAKRNFSVAKIREELLKGNTVVVWASYQFQRPAGYFRYTDTDGHRRFTYANFHVMLLNGMNDNYVFITDPILGKLKISISRFNKAYKPYGSQALVV